MNDTPGWASPGSAPSDGEQPGTSAPADRPAPPGDRPAGAPPPPPTTWSQGQPPGGGWSLPTGPGPHPPPGRGATGHASWGGPPPAPKPGVIPLRPLGVGEILDGAVSTMRSHWRPVLGISLTIAVVTQVIVTLVQGALLDTGLATLGDPTAPLDDAASLTTVFGAGLVYMITLIGVVVATALLTTVTGKAVLGRNITAAEAWRDARPRLPALFGLILLILLIVTVLPGVGALPGLLAAAAGGGAAVTGPLLVLGVLGAGVVTVWIGVGFVLAPPALMLEKQGLVKALRRSRGLVRGSWWRIFGIWLLAMVIANVVAAIVAMPFSALALVFGTDAGALLAGDDGFGWTFLVLGGIGSVLGSLITLPLWAGVTALLYIDQRIRREALDLDLLRAAGTADGTRPDGVPGS
nr:hypothetical protein [Streptomyces sp. HSG2]